MTDDKVTAAKLAIERFVEKLCPYPHQRGLESYMREQLTLAIQGSIREAMMAVPFDDHIKISCFTSDELMKTSPEAVVLGRLRERLENNSPDYLTPELLLTFIDRELELARKR